MSNNLTQYFDRRAYQPKWFLGDRVSGKWNRIPFIGTVGNDRIVSLERGPEVTVHLDLPIRHNGQTHHILVVKHRDIRPLKEL